MAIGLVLIGLAYLALMALVVVLATTTTSFNAVVVAALVILHAVGAAGGILGGIAMWRRSADGSPLVAALAVVLVSVLAAVLIPENSFLYSVLAAAAAFCAVGAWRASREGPDHPPAIDDDQHPTSEPPPKLGQ